jgi:hypothetical protein
MPCDGNRSWLARMMELAMTAFGSRKPPTLPFKPLDYFANFHRVVAVSSLHFAGA